jgi:hypothetical protein
MQLTRTSTTLYEGKRTFDQLHIRIEQGGAGEVKRTIEQLGERSSLCGLSHIPLDDVLPMKEYVIMVSSSTNDDVKKKE